MMRPAVHTAQLFLMKQSNFSAGCLLCFAEKVFYRSFLDPVSVTNYNKKICERGGIGRRTGFRILRLAHKGSSPFARTISISRKTGGFFIAVKTPFDNALPAKGVYFKTGYDFEIGYKEIL